MEFSKNNQGYCCCTVMIQTQCTNNNNKGTQQQLPPFVTVSSAAITLTRGSYCSTLVCESRTKVMVFYIAAAAVIGRTGPQVSNKQIGSIYWIVEYSICAYVPGMYMYVCMLVVDTE